MARKSIWKIAAIILGIFAAGILIYAAYLLFVKGVIETGTIVFLLLALLVLLLCFWIWQITSRIHPHVKKYYLTTISIEDVLNKVNKSESFPIELGGKPVEIQVVPERASDLAAAIIVAGEDREIDRSSTDEVITFAGHIAGFEETSEVRLTITPLMMGGYVLDGGNWWFIEPLKKFQMDAEQTDYMIYRTRDLQFKLSNKDDLVRHTMEQFDPYSLPGGSGYIGEPPLPPVDTSKHSVGPDIGIVMVADKEFYEGVKWTNTPWYIHQIKTLNEVNGLYKKNIGFRFLTKAWIMDPVSLTSSNGKVLLTQLITSVGKLWANLGLVSERMRTGTEVAHLTSGKDMDGKLLGIADFWTVGNSLGLGGVYSLSQQYIKQTLFGGADIFGNIPNLAYQDMMVMAHELGHSFNAVHEEAVEWCVTSFIICLDYERSLMWDTYYDDNKDWISDGKYRKGHDNRKRMINNAKHFRTYDLV